MDYYTFSYYMSNTITTHDVEEKAGGNNVEGARNPYLRYSDWGWGFDPLGLRYFLEVINDRYHKPIMIVETGWAPTTSSRRTARFTTTTVSTTSARI